MIADPFARTAEVRALLELRTAQLRARAGAVRTFAGQRRPEHGLHPLWAFARAS